MEKFKQLQKIKEVYEKGGNIIQFLKSIDENKGANSIEEILISYDFQSGTYVKGLTKNLDYKLKYTQKIAQIIQKLGGAESIIEVGVGEATTLGVLIKSLEKKPEEILGFDISWSRLKFAKHFLEDIGLNDVKLFSANLFEIPLQDNSIDIVYTSHSIEPNGGKEEEALKELYRIAGKYLILLEPSYEFANQEARDRMNQHGYVTKLHKTAVNLGYKILEHRLFDYSINPLNPTGLLIIEKEEAKPSLSTLTCPISRTPLSQHSGSLLYSKDSFLAYPVIEGIPCLLKENSILAIHLLTDYEAFKKANDISFELANI